VDVVSEIYIYIYIYIYICSLILFIMTKIVKFYAEIYKKTDSGHLQQLKIMMLVRCVATGFIKKVHRKMSVATILIY
jgi:hypothetical protein